MDDSYGGAKPKTKTPRKNEKPRKHQQKETDQSEIEKPSFTSKQQSSPDDCDSRNVLYFKDDHFDENSCSKRRSIKLNTKRGGVVRDTRRNFVKEFLPLTDEAIKNAIKGINDRNDTSTGIKQSSSSSTDLERDSRTLSEVTECKKRKKELSPREKWKRSGFALRKYLASKFGFTSKQKQELQESCLNCVPTEKATKQKHKHVCVNPDLSQEENQPNDASKNLFIGKNHCDTSNICNKENVVNGHSSHSLLKVLRKSKDKKKCKISPNCDSNGRDTSTTEETTSPSSSSQVQDTEHSDCSNSLNQLSWEQFTCNSLNQNKKTRTCVRNVPSSELFSRDNRSTQLVLPLSDISSLSVLPESSSHRIAKTCRRSRPDRENKSKRGEKKTLVGVFDAAIASSSDSENDDTKRSEVIKRPKRRSHSREVKTDQTLPLRGFVLSGTPQHRENDSDHSKLPAHQARDESDHNISSGSDVLLGLKYALPYLPERLRNRLHSTTQNQDDAVSNTKKKTTRNSNEIQANSICDIDTDNSTSEHASNNCNLEVDNAASHISDLQASRYTKDYTEVDTLGITKQGEITDNAANRFPFERLSNNDSLKSDLSNDNLWTREKSEQTTEPHHELTDDVKFHLNEETGTWTMSGFDEKYEKSIKGGNNLWSPLGYELGQIRRDSYTDWVEQDLLELESSLEDPFNLRGDNLMLNDTSSSSKGDNSFTGSDPFNLRGDNLMLNDTFSSKGDNSFTDCDKDECVYHGTSHYMCKEKKLDNKNGMHEGLMDLVNGIDEPFVRDDSVNNRRVDKQTNMSETSLPSFWDKWRNHRDLLQADHNDSQSSGPEDQPILEQQSQDWSLRENGISTDLLSKDSCYEHIEKFSAKGYHSQDTTKGNNSQDTTKGNHSQDTTQEMRPRLPVIDREAMTPSSTVDDLHSPRSWYTLSQDSSLDADDEFECDCEHCISLRRSHIDAPSYLDLGFMGQPRLESVSENLEPEDDSLASDYAGHNEVDLGLGVHIFESGVGLGLGVMLENVILQLLTDNVIIQMINVQPDLMSDQAPPPVPQSVIDAIPTVSLSQHDIEENPVCPVCLCPVDEGETMSQLPCQHMFHPICVQAWLVKSGTCPVCRYRM